MRMEDADLSDIDFDARHPPQDGPCSNNDRRNIGCPADVGRRLEADPQYKPRYDNYSHLNRDIATIYIAIGNQV